jgi:hypothetical protein
MPRFTALLAAALVAVPLAAAQPAAKPSLRIAAMRPLALTGANFKSGERVVVRADYGGDISFRKATASSTGRFTVSFAGIRLTRCGPDLEVLATGSLGSRFAFTLHHADCPSK